MSVLLLVIFLWMLVVLCRKPFRNRKPFREVEYFCFAIFQSGSNRSSPAKSELFSCACCLKAWAPPVPKQGRFSRQSLSRVMGSCLWLRTQICQKGQLQLQLQLQFRRALSLKRRKTPQLSLRKLLSQMRRLSHPVRRLELRVCLRSLSPVMPSWWKLRQLDSSVQGRRSTASRSTWSSWGFARKTWVL